jgi:hypothetical protein
MRRFSLVALLSLVVGATLVVSSSPASAEQLRLQRASKHDRRAQIHAPELHARIIDQIEVRLEGTIQYDPKTGLSIDDEPILIDLATCLSSERFDDFPAPRSLDGAEVTLFGRMTHRGVRATLILDRTESSIQKAIRRPLPNPYVKANPDDPRAGVYLESAPR